MEFRDAQGELIRRIHVKFDQSPFSKGHRPLRESIHSGIGYLLTKYQSSGERGKSYLNVALKHLVQGAGYGQSIEDSFIYLVRAMKNLCQYYGFKTQYLMRGLDINQQQAVKQILATAAQQILIESQAAARAGRLDQSRTLDNIAKRTTETPANKDNNFGLAVADLLKHFSLPDADIVDAHYQANPRPDNLQKWSGVLSFYRGAPIHSGYFNISGKQYDFNDIWIIKNHVHDILLRIIFKITGYDGSYQPPVIKMTSDMPIDWVTPSLTADRLGYT